MNPPGRRLGRALRLTQKTGLGSGPPPVPAGAEDSSLERNVSLLLGYFSCPLSSVCLTFVADCCLFIFFMSVKFKLFLFSDASGGI